MNAGFKLVESSRFSVGENHAKWNLILACYQHYDNYCFVVFDENDRSEYIQSAIVTPETSNTLEEAIISTIQNPFGLEVLNDVFERLQTGFYGSMFEMRNVEQ